MLDYLKGKLMKKKLSQFEKRKLKEQQETEACNRARILNKVGAKMDISCNILLILLAYYVGVIVGRFLGQKISEKFKEKK